MYIENTFIRKARKEYLCQGSGSALHSCSNIINKGDTYLEYVGERALYQSGTRHCMECANKFYMKETPEITQPSVVSKAEQKVN